MHLCDVGVCCRGVVEAMRENIADVGFNQRRGEVALDKAGGEGLNGVAAAAAAARAQYGPARFVDAQVAGAAGCPG